MNYKPQRTIREDHLLSRQLFFYLDLLPKNFAQGQLSSFTERQSLDDLKYICMRQIETREEKMCSRELISEGPEKEKDFTHKSSAMGITFDLDTCTWFKVTARTLSKDTM